MLILLFALLVVPGVVRGDDRTQFTLPNGLRVRLVPSRDDGKVVVILGVRAGFFDEPSGRPHLAHVVEHALVFSAPEGSDEEKAVNRWFQAGQANGETLAEFMYFDLSPAANDLAMALRVQAERLAHPRFSREVLEREVPRALSEIDFLEKSPLGGPGKFAYSAFVQSAYHGQTDVGIRARTRAFTVDDLRDFHARTFHPARAVLCLIGSFDPVAARKSIEATFGAAPDRKAAQAARPVLKPGSATVKWDVATRHLVLAWQAPAAAEADHPALSLAALLLMQRLYTDPEIGKLVKLQTASNDVERLFLVTAQIPDGADLDATQGKLLDAVGRLARPDGLSDADVASARFGLAQQLGPIDVDAIALPANVSKAMARANVELQRMMKESAWGDLPAYAKRANDLSRAQVRSATKRYLDPRLATIVRIVPAN